jgi:hypothetical protein
VDGGFTHDGNGGAIGIDGNINGGEEWWLLIDSKIAVIATILLCF